MSLKLYDHACNNTLARTHDAIDKVCVNNLISFLNNLHFEGDKISF